MPVDNRNNPKRLRVRTEGSAHDTSATKLIAEVFDPVVITICLSPSYDIFSSCENGQELPGVPSNGTQGGVRARRSMEKENDRDKWKIKLIGQL